MELPKVVTPEEARVPDAVIQAEAAKAVTQINGQLKNMAPDGSKVVAVFLEKSSLAYSVVLKHFRQHWNVREKQYIEQDQRDPRDVGYWQWEFSAPGQLDR